MRWVYEAYAKLNWTLNILYKRSDGYHEMDMLMQSVSLHDTLHMEPSYALSMDILGLSLSLSEDNLVLRAARALQAHTGYTRGARLRLVKRIPVAAGMGGGSTDAAAALIGLNQLWQTHLPLEVLGEIALKIGADIPFCLTGGLARAQGVGEKLTPLRAGMRRHLVLLKPCIGVSTQEVFTRYAEEPSTARPPNTDAAQQALTGEGVHDLIPHLGNVMEPITFSLRPMLYAAIEDLIKTGALAAQMSGSGPTLFGLYENEAAAKAAYQKLKSLYTQCWYVHTVEEGIRLKAENRPSLR